MPAGKSKIGNISTRTLSVAKGLTEIHDRMQEFLKHLESRKAHLEALLADTHQDDVAALLAAVTAAIDKLQKAMELVQQGIEAAKKVEARL
jgi:uncharacterized protein Yka (UPF0111/DUF47 family)